MLLVFDLVQRYLRSRGFNVTYVRNITDIDDKIIQRAAENGEEWSALARRFADAMQEDCAVLGLWQPDAEPRATEFIEPIIRMTQTLIDKGYAYVAVDGDVLYSVRKFASYGRLSGKKIDDLKAGARVQVDGSTVVETNFLDGTQSATTTLTAGYHTFDLLYYQNGGGQNLEYSVTPGEATGGDGFSVFQYTATEGAVPEPTSLSLFAAGLLGLVVYRLRLRRG